MPTVLPLVPIVCLLYYPNQLWQLYCRSSVAVMICDVISGAHVGQRFFDLLQLVALRFAQVRLAAHGRARHQSRPSVTRVQITASVSMMASVTSSSFVTVLLAELTTLVQLQHPLQHPLQHQ